MLDKEKVQDDQPTSASPNRQRLQAAVRNFKRIAPFSSGVFAALAALLIFNLVIPKPDQLTERDINEAIAQAMASATPPPAYSARVYQVIRPSLVLIQTEGQDASGEEGRGLGSGVVINDAGEILTSLHVVSGAREIEVIFADGTEAEAQVTVEQPENDIAVLSPNRLPELLVPAVLGSAASMQVGDEAFVVGNPFGLYGSMSSGVISGFEREFHPAESEQRLEGLIQVDAAINPGNSGGPLLNRNGHVIGVVVGIINPTEQEVFIGIGFAVPIGVAAGAAGAPAY